jgi:hypothetical protein
MTLQAGHAGLRATSGRFTRYKQSCGLPYVGEEKQGTAWAMSWCVRIWTSPILLVLAGLILRRQPHQQQGLSSRLCLFPLRGLDLDSTPECAPARIRIRGTKGGRSKQLQPRARQTAPMSRPLTSDPSHTLHVLRAGPFQTPMPARSAPKERENLSRVAEQGNQCLQS